MSSSPARLSPRTELSQLTGGWGRREFALPCRRPSAANSHITPGRILDRFQRALAGDARGHFGRALAGEPNQPVRPPRTEIFLGLGEPAFQVGVARPLAGPILVFVLGRRVDHAGDVAR